MNGTMRRVAAGLVTAVAAGTLSMAMAAPAQATPAQCTAYLQARGYTVGPKVQDACRQAVSPIGGALGPMRCSWALRAIGVDRPDAQAACKLAAA
ncbi:hypothetical protein [Saccharopolyspora gregorii]|uniref:hypothetical protein n=1 Tax=Saccharopolyspora gregorii TaxID=33914 RepID=UPI0021ACDBAE|nr:hypothetical protein [Saccharopolyspora gregorii]